MVEQRRYRTFYSKIQRVATQKAKKEAALAALEQQLIRIKHIQNNLEQIPAARQAEYTNETSDVINTKPELPVPPG